MQQKSDSSAMRLPLLFALLLMTACADRGQLDYLAAPPEDQTIRQVFIASSRTPDPQTGQPGSGRSADLHLARFDVAIPPAHVLGQIELPRRGQPLDPQRHFALAGSQELTVPGFRRALAQALHQLPPAEREAVVIVHGFNNTFREGLYRAAQLSHDLNIPGVTLHYTWPSLAAPLAYAHDRDSALFARDGLEAALRETLAAGAPRIALVAHSMGAHLLMETLRQIAIAGDRHLLDRISAVVLISPDLDIELFHAQARRIGRLPEPFLIITSQRDRVLRLSARLTGQRSRLGNLDEAESLSDLAVTLIDVSAFSTGIGHFTVGSSPALIQLLDQAGALGEALGTDAGGQLSLLPATILTIRNTTQIILEPLSGL